VCGCVCVCVCVCVGVCVCVCVCVCSRTYILYMYICICMYVRFVHTLSREISYTMTCITLTVNENYVYFMFNLLVNNILCTAIQYDI